MGSPSRGLGWCSVANYCRERKVERCLSKVLIRCLKEVRKKATSPWDGGELEGVPAERTANAKALRQELAGRAH